MNPLVKVSLRYGLLAGAIGSALLIGLYYMDRHPFLIPVYIDFRIILFGILIFFTLREVRDYYQNGVMYFWQGFLASFLFTLAYAIVSSVVLVVFMELVPAFVSDYISLSVAQLKSLPSEVIESIGKDVYERNLKMLPETDADDLGSLYFLQSFLISLFISIILSVILRRQPQT
ncbi:MAG TPA: DUF4199 domain-containing protein [Chryseosolibacter sp.]|nr:DUF4199 domain-containing protein [Chryseosolibacter sp.]